MINKRVKSAHLAVSLQSKARSSRVQPRDAEIFPQISEKIKKWQQIAKEVNHEVQLCGYAYRGLSSHQSLSKFGKNSFQLAKSIDQIRILKPLRPADTIKQNHAQSHLKQLQKLRTSESKKRIIKKAGRKFIQFRETNKYDRPILKIGCNMQYEQKLIKYHIENIKKVQAVEPSSMPIIFGIKSQTQTFKPCMAFVKSQQMPICISIFAQSFDAKFEQSNVKKKSYFKQMLKQMNGTYDPEIMSKFPLINNKKSFDKQQYFSHLQKFAIKITSQQQKYLQYLVIKFLQKQFKFVSKDQFELLKEELIQNYEQGSAIVNLDYFLKDYENLKQMNMLRQYLSAKKENIVSLRIIYHGGYSKTLYNSWNNYVQHCRTQLPKKICKFSSKVQQVNKWLYYFSDLNMTETNLFEILISPIQLNQLKVIQLRKIQQIFGFFNNVCIKGVMTILQHNRLLQKTQGEFLNLIKPFKKYDYLKPQSKIKGLFEIDFQAEHKLFQWYQNLLESKHVFKKLHSFEQLQLANEKNEQISQIQKKKINKSISIQINIFFSNIVSNSLRSFINIFANPKQPYLKLKLIVDRQSIKLMQNEQSVLQVFNTIIKQIISKHVHCSSSGMTINQPSKSNYKYYGNLRINDQQQNTFRDSNAWELDIQYRNIGIHEQDIKNMMKKIKESYHQSQLLIQNFSAFMPFIKLTAKEKIFVQEQELTGKSEWDQTKQLFNLNKQKVKFYRDKLAQIPEKFNIGIFSVDCSQPHKILRERISEIEYLLQQKYLSRIFQKIHQMQQQHAKIMTVLHSINIKVHSSIQINEIFHKSKVQLLQIKKKTKQLAKHIYFYVDKQIKSNTLISRFTQLIYKRQLLLTEIQELKEKINQDSYYLDIKRQGQRNIFRKRIEVFQNRLDEFCKQYFQIPKMQKYISGLKNLKQQFNEFRTQFNELKDPNCQYQSQQQLFQNINNEMNIVCSYWQHMHTFNSTIKQLNRQRIREIETNDYEKIVKSSVDVIKTFEQLNVEINQINAGYLTKFKTQVFKHQQYLQYIKILSNQSIPLEYFTLFKCEELLNLTFKDVFQADNPDIPEKVFRLDDSKFQLKQLELRAKAEQQILTKYSTIDKKFKSYKLIIIDFNGCDTLDPQLTKDRAKKLRQQSFECQRLLLSKYSQKFSSKITKLRKKMLVCEEILLKWLEIQKQFVQLDSFYRNNQDAYYKDQFKHISESHRKIIKSFDMDNSVLLLPSNSFLVSSLESCFESMIKLKQQIYQKFNDLQSLNSRLQLLTHDQLLEMTSYIKTIPKHLRKILPSIQNIGLNDETIERVGGIITNSRRQEKGTSSEIISGNSIKLRQPVHLGFRLVNIQIWLERFLMQIKQTLKQMFLMINKKQSCLQIIFLKQQLIFTQQVEYIIGDAEDIEKKLQSYARSIQLKIEERIKSDLDKYEVQMITLLLVMQRDIINSLIQNEDCQSLTLNSFEWTKNARFYNYSQIQNKKATKIDVRMKVLAHQYQYNFMFIENCQYSINDALFMGNCFVGNKGIGKRSLIRHYAYMTGNELFQFQMNRISQNFIENMVNYYKIAITTGSWLVIPQINQLSFQQLKVLAECMSSMNQAINSKLEIMNMFVYKQFRVNQNCRVFFTMQNFNSIPARLAHNFRPVWMCPPSLQFINSIYNDVQCLIQSSSNTKRQNYYQTESNNMNYKIIDFVYYNRNLKDIPLCLTKPMLNQSYKQLKQNFMLTSNNLLNLLTKIKLILPEDLSARLVDEENIDWILENSPQIVIYVPELLFNNFIQNNFCSENSVWIRLKLVNFIEVRKTLRYIESEKKRQKIQYIILQNNLLNYKIILNELYSSQIVQKNIRIIFLQNINKLEQEQRLRVQVNFPTIILWGKRKNIKETKDNKFKKINFKNAYLNFQDFAELDPLYQPVLENIVKYLKNRSTQQTVQQTVRVFNKLYTKMINQMYSKEVSFIFAYGWIFGNYISQPQLLKQLSQITQSILLQKILKMCVNLRELNPCKNQFIFLSQNMQQVHKFKLFQGDLQFKSIILSNFKLITELMKDQIIGIKSQFQVSEIIHGLFSTCFNLYPTDLITTIFTKNQLEHILKIQSQSNSHPHFIIHSADKLHKQVFQFINQFAHKQYAYYEEGGDLNKFQSIKSQFIFSAGLDFSYQSHNIISFSMTHDDIIAIQIDQLRAILKCHSSNYNFQESIFKGLINLYRIFRNKYYWLQYPIRIAYKKYLKQKDKQDKEDRENRENREDRQSRQDREFKEDNIYFLCLLRYLLLSLPQQKIKITNQICYSAKPVSLLKGQQTEYHINMINFSQTNRSLDQSLTNGEIGIRKNICKDLIVFNEAFNATPYTYDMLYKTYLAISQTHTVLLGTFYSQRYYCLSMASKILNIQIIPFNLTILKDKQEKNIQEKKRKIMIIKQYEMTDQTLTILQSLICRQNSLINKKYIIVLKINSTSEQTFKMYRKFPFLRKYFIHVQFPENSKQQLTQNINLIKVLKNLEAGQTQYELSMLNDWEIPPVLQVEKSIGQYFQAHLKKKFGFLVKLLEIRKEFQSQEFNKYKFYRILTEQLFHIISQFETQLKSIPQKIQTIEKNKQELTQKKHQLQIDQQNLQVEIKNQKQQSRIEQNTLDIKIKELQQLQDKMNVTKKQAQLTFKKIYQKLDGASIQEHGKFKLSDCQLTNSVYNLIAGLIKWQPGKLKKLPTDSLDVLVQESGKLEKCRELKKKILLNWRNSKKKNEKISLIFLCLLEWIQGIDKFIFRSTEQNDKIREIIKKLEQQIDQSKQKNVILKNKIRQSEQKLTQCVNSIQRIDINEKELKLMIEAIKIRRIRMEKILKQLLDNQYKIKISKDLAERLYFMPKIIMAKSISEISLNQYEDDEFIAKSLFLRSFREDEAGQITDNDIFKFGMPLFHNIFDDFDSIVQVYQKYNLKDMDFDQVKLIHTIINSKQKVHLIEDAHDIIGSKLCELCRNHLNFKILNLYDANLQFVSKQIIQKTQSYNRILITLSRYSRQDEIKKLISAITTVLDQNENVRIILLFKRFQPIYQTDRFRLITDSKINLTLRRYMRQFAKIIEQKQFVNEWEYYQNQNQFNKLHKMLFEAVQKFQPENQDSYEKMAEIIKKLEQSRSKRKNTFQVFQKYLQYLSTLSVDFNPYYILLKFIESIDRINPIGIFESGNLFKNYQAVLKKTVSLLYQCEIKKKQDLFKKFIVSMSNIINFIDENQVNQYCMIVAFLMSKPEKITSFYIFKLLRESEQFPKQKQRIKYLIETVSGKKVNITAIEQMIKKKKIQNQCQDWLKYLIYATSSSYQLYSQSFINAIKQTKYYSIIQQIKQRTHAPEPHYYAVKSKIDLKNQFRASVTSRQRACKIFWLVKVKKQHSQKFMQVLQGKFSSIKEQIKLVNFFFNQKKFDQNFNKLKQLSEQKIFVCIFNLSKTKYHIAEQIIWNLQNYKNINPLFKIFFLLEEEIQLKNREQVDYIYFIPTQKTSEQCIQKRIIEQINKNVTSIANKQKISNNLNIINSLHVIVEKCLTKMSINKEKDKIFKFLLTELLKPDFICQEDNVSKLLVEYFKMSKISHQQMDQYCKLKQPMTFFEQKPPELQLPKQLSSATQNIEKWVSLGEKLMSCPHIQNKYSIIIKNYIDKIIENQLRQQYPKLIINESQIKNIIKYGWIIIEDVEILKFLLYQCLKQELKNSIYEDSYEILGQLSLVCENKTNILFKYNQFNQMFSGHNTVTQLELKIKAIQQFNEDVLIDRNEIQLILQHYNIRLSLAGVKDSLGTLFVTYK